MLKKRRFDEFTTTQAKQQDALVTFHKHTSQYFDHAVSGREV
jgi:hypothetical protein